jgi:hypothetical protein
MSNGMYALNLATSKYMANTTIPVSTNYTAFAVGYTSQTGYARILNAIPEAYFFMGTGNGNTQYASFAGYGTWNDVATNSPATSITSLCMMEMTNNNTSSGLIPYVNGTALNAKNGSCTAFTGLDIGVEYNPSITQYWNGFIAEIIIYNSVLTTTQRQQVEGYLAWKWGIQSSLPVAHPYYSTSALNSTVSTAITYNSDTSVVKSLLTAPAAPTIGTATSTGQTTATVAFTPPSGTVTSYTVTSSPGSITATGTTSPISVSGLTAGTTYTFTITATNASGTSVASTASNNITTTSSADAYQTAANIQIAYGMFLIVPAYTGAIINVRRSSDNATSDFYSNATQSYLTTGSGGTGTTYASWIGANTGYITTIYNQAGGTNHGTQTTTGQQPSIALVNSKYVASFNAGSLTYFNLTATIIPYTVFTHFYPIGATNFNSVISSYPSDYAVRFVNGTFNTNNQDWWYNSSGTKLAYLNNTSVNSGGTNTATVTASAWNVLSLSATTGAGPAFTVVGTDGYDRAGRGLTGYMTCMICNNTSMASTSMTAFYNNRLI